MIPQLAGYDVATLRPLSHEILIQFRYLLPSDACALGFIQEPREILPTDVTPLLARRVIGFLTGRYPVPPAYLASLIPASEAQDARRAFQKLVAQGVSPGDAIVELGILQPKEWHNVPATGVGRVIAAGCDCAGSPGDDLLLASSCGRSLNTYDARCYTRVISCSEALAQVEVPEGTRTYPD